MTGSALNFSPYVSTTASNVSSVNIGFNLSSPELITQSVIEFVTLLLSKLFDAMVDSIKSQMATSMSNNSIACSDLKLFFQNIALSVLNNSRSLGNDQATIFATTFAAFLEKLNAVLCANNTEFKKSQALALFKNFFEMRPFFSPTFAGIRFENRLNDPVVQSVFTALADVFSVLQSSVCTALKRQLIGIPLGIVLSKPVMMNQYDIRAQLPGMAFLSDPKLRQTYSDFIDVMLDNITTDSMIDVQKTAAVAQIINAILCPDQTLDLTRQTDPMLWFKI